MGNGAEELLVWIVDGLTDEFYSYADIINMINYA